MCACIHTLILFHVEHYCEIKQLLVSGSVSLCHTITKEEIDQFYLYFNELVLWNQRMNLTGLRSIKDIITTLFLDSLAGERIFSDGSGKYVLDVGSGGGFPGLPLKIVRPDIHLTLVEPTLKKVTFLRHIIGTLGLEGVDILPKRIQEMVGEKGLIGKFDYVISKALRVDSFLPFAQQFLHDCGKVVLYRSKSMDGCEHNYGMNVVREIHYELPFGFGRRMFVILEPIHV